MRDVDRESLPTLAQAQADYQEHKIFGLRADRATVQHEIEWEEALVPDGTVTVENFQHLTAIGGWNGYTRLMPLGVKPKDPELEARRPSQHRSDHETT
jgi:hypothetical protein